MHRNFIIHCSSFFFFLIRSLSEDWFWKLMYEKANAFVALIALVCWPVNLVNNVNLLGLITQAGSCIQLDN